MVFELIIFDCFTRCTWQRRRQPYRHTLVTVMRFITTRGITLTLLTPPTGRNTTSLPPFAPPTSTWCTTIPHPDGRTFLNSRSWRFTQITHRVISNYCVASNKEFRSSWCIAVILSMFISQFLLTKLLWLKLAGSLLFRFPVFVVYQFYS